MKIMIQEVSKDIFNYELKMKFDIYDVNNDGQISIEELFYMLHDTFMDLVSKEKQQENKIVLDKIVKSISNDIMHKLDKDSNGSLDWNEFKQYLKTE